MKFGLLILLAIVVVISIWVCKGVERFEASTTQLEDPNIGDPNCIGTTVPDYGVMWACDSNKMDIIRILRSTGTREACARRCITDLPQSEAQGLCLRMCGSPFDCAQALNLAGEPERSDVSRFCSKEIEHVYANMG